MAITSKYSALSLYPLGSFCMAMVALVSICSCTMPSATRSYANAEVGLELTYPSTWRLVDKKELSRAVDTASDRMPLNKTDVLDIKSFVPEVIFSIAKPQKIAGIVRNPNLIVMAIEVPAPLCVNINSQEFLLDEIEAYETSMPGVTANAEEFPLPKRPQVHNFTARVELKDRVATQHRYFYCRNSIYVQIVATASHIEDEQELRKILSTIDVMR
jgi:hypothetical protein